MAKARPDRDTVFLWMELQRQGAAAAAKHFGLPASTVRRWLSEARSDGVRTPGERSPSAERGASQAQSSGRPVARPTDGSTGKPESRLQGMRGEDRTRILKFKDQTLDFLASENAVKDPGATRSLISALTSLLEAIPDLMEADNRMAGMPHGGGLDESGAAGPGPSADRLRGALAGLGPGHEG